MFGGAPPAVDVEGGDVGAEHVAAVLAVDSWRLSGRIGVQREDKGFSGALEWRQRGARFDLRITAPLNGGTFALAGDDARVSLILPDGQTHHATSAEALMNTHLGWTIPVSGARYWVRGVPAPQPAAAQQRHDSAGRLTDFAQAGWRISILDYQDEAEPALPRKLFLNRDTLKVRMVVKTWERLE